MAIFSIVLSTKETPTIVVLTITTFKASDISKILGLEILELE
jgi:hypothetical protein